MLRIASVTKSLRGAALGLLGILTLAIPAAAQAQNQPGRFLLTPRRDIVLECNLNASNCFNVTGASQAAGDPGGGDQDVSRANQPSIAQNGTIAFEALFSPDGACVVGAQGICQPHVFLMNADGTNVRQITFNPANPNDASHFGGDNFASISPDGTMVAFVAIRNPAADGNYVSAVYVVNSDGSGLHQVTPFAYDGNGGVHGNMYSVAWSPDSKKLAFKGTSYGTFCGTYFGSPIDFLVVGLINVDGTGQTFLACDSVNAAGGAFAIDWSPDGTLIADARDSIHFGEPAIRITDLSGQGRFSSGLTTAQLGPQASFGGELCPSDGHCIHFSPDSTRLAYENNSPSDNPSFYGISTINLDGTGRSDAAPFGATLENGIWWDAGAYPAPALQLTLAPNPVEVWPGFSQQLTPSLLDASNNLILHTARTYDIHYVPYHACGIEIGPYGLVMFRGFNGFPNIDGSTISAGNEGLTSNSVPFKCFASPPCTYTLSPSSGNFLAAGGSGSFSIIADPGSTGSSCPWGPIINVPWITITSGSSSSGNGSLSFNVAANTGAARQGTIMIGGATFTVNQAPPGPAAGSLVVVKSTVGGNGTFTFTGTGTGVPASFQITTSGNTGSYPAITNLAPGSGYSVSEQSQAGWDPASSGCTNGTPGNITIVAGQTTTCTFTNTQRGTIVVTKVTNPNPDPTHSSFNFAAGGGLSPSTFSLANGGTRTFGNLLPASGYSVSETTPNNGQTGWASTLGCTSALGASTKTITGSSVSISLGAGDTMTCTFTNATAFAKVTKTFNGGPIPAGACGTGTNVINPCAFTFQLRSGASATAAGTILESETASSGSGVLNFTTLLIPGQQYQMCEQLLPGWLTTLGPPLYAVFNLSGDNSVVCTNFTPDPGQTAPFTISNQPPPGGMALTIGFWKNWASCANSGGKQQPVLDRTLASFPGGGVYVGNLFVNTCQIAVNILNKSTANGTKAASSSAYSLAAQLLAAELNVQAGAGSNACVATDITSAGHILAPVTDLLGNTGIDFAKAFNNNSANPTMTSPEVTDATYLQTQLNNYNNNLSVQCSATYQF